MDKKYISFICCISQYVNTPHFNELIYDLINEYGQLKNILQHVPWSVPLNYQKEMKGILETVILVSQNQLTLNEFVELKKYCMLLEFNTKNGFFRVKNINSN